MYWLGSSGKHHVSLGCQIVLLKLLNQEFDHAGGLGVTSTANSSSTVQAAVLVLVL